MQRLLRCAGALAITFGGGCATSAARHEILRNNERLFHAIGARDVATLAQLITPDFRFETGDGQAGDRQAWLAAIAGRSAVVESISNDELRLRIDGDHALLCGTQRATVVVDGKRVRDEARFCDRWEKRDGRWLGAFAGVPATR